MDRLIETVAGIADDVVASAGGQRRIGLAIDEWNVWYLRRHQARFQPHDWPVAPHLCEDAYTVADAVVVGSLLIAFLRHADRVGSACLAQLVNVIAPIKTEARGPVWREATFYPFSVTAARARGEAVPLAVDGPVLSTTTHGDVPVIDAVATVEESGAASLFVVNRHPGETVDLVLDAPDHTGIHLLDAVLLSDPDVHASNSREQPDRVRPKAMSGHDGRQLRLRLPPVSWVSARLQTGSGHSLAST
jgi:alpha-N-arabinofuranosidase